MQHCTAMDSHSAYGCIAPQILDMTGKRPDWDVQGTTPRGATSMGALMKARHDSAEDFSRLGALLFTDMARIFIPAYCFAIP